MARKPSKRRFAERGVTLLEGLMSSFILLFGLVGVLSGIIYASQQNASANKMTRAGAFATQIRSGLLAQGITRLNGASPVGLFNSCDTSAATVAAADGMDNISGYTTCLADVDAYDFTGGRPANMKIVPGFAQADRTLFRRVAIRMNDSGGKTVGVAIVVSWREGLGWRYHHQYVAFYNTSRYRGLDL